MTYAKGTIYTRYFVSPMSDNACFATHNAPGQNCSDTSRGSFQIPTGGPWIDIGTEPKQFKVTYFKYAARIAYDVRYEPSKWSCTCPDFEFNDREALKTCCKHIQACIDKAEGTTRPGGNYEQFLVEHVHD